VTDALMAEIARNIAANDRRRAERVKDTLDGLSARERALLREAAVMGWVRGHWAAGGTQRAPADSAIVAEVVDAMFAFPELYPTVTGYVEPTEETPVKRWWNRVQPRHRARRGVRLPRNRGLCRR